MGMFYAKEEKPRFDDINVNIYKFELENNKIQRKLLSFGKGNK